MPIIKSAKKRVRVSAKANERNKRVRNNLRDALKSFSAVLKGKGDAANAHAEAQSALDAAVKKGLIHKNKAARKKSQLAQAAKSSKASIKGPGSTKKAPAKSVKAPVKKAAPKKPVAKKASPKTKKASK